MTQLASHRESTREQKEYTHVEWSCIQVVNDNSTNCWSPSCV